MPVRDEHDWELLGGAAGWELWACTRCGTERYPSVVGLLWRLRWWLNRCPAPSRRGRLPHVDLRRFYSTSGGQTHG